MDMYRLELEEHEYTAWSYSLGSAVHLGFSFGLNLITQDVGRRMDSPEHYTSELAYEGAMIYVAFAFALAISMFVVSAASFGFFMYTLYFVKPHEAEIMGVREGGSPVLEMIRGVIAAACHASVGACLLIGCFMLFDEWNSASLGVSLFLEFIAIGLVLADVEFVFLQFHRLRDFRRTSSLV